MIYEIWWQLTIIYKHIQLDTIYLRFIHLYTSSYIFNIIKHNSSTLIIKDNKKLKNKTHIFIQNLQSAKLIWSDEISITETDVTQTFENSM